MHDFVKHIWIILVISTAFSLIGYIMTSQFQPSFMRELNKIQSIPQQRIDATYRYIEAIESGEITPSDTLSSEPPKKYYKEQTRASSQSSLSAKYQKPLYVRDKRNPCILHKLK